MSTQLTNRTINVFGSNDKSLGGSAIISFENAESELERPLVGGDGLLGGRINFRKNRNFSGYMRGLLLEKSLQELNQRPQRQVSFWYLNVRNIRLTRKTVISCRRCSY